MPLYIVKENILKVPAEVIVNPSDGIDFNGNVISRSISQAAGEKYAHYISTFPRLALGSVKFSDTFELNNKYIAHVALPMWYGGTRNEEEYIDSCYSEVLYEADSVNVSSVVFPLLGVGLYGVPYEESLKIAIKVIVNYLSVKDSLSVFIAVIDEQIYNYIQNNYCSYCIANDEMYEMVSRQSLEYKIGHLGCRFIDLLTTYIDRMEISTVQCYTAAGIDKKLFSKIKNNCQYKPSKNTIIKFAFALHLSLDETQQLLGTCGYVLSESIVDDVIIKHYLSQRMYCLEDVYREIKERSL